MGDSSGVRAPVFVVGAERSGSTLLRIMLDGHTDIACIGQFEYTVDAIAAAGGRIPSGAEYRSFLESDRIFNLHDLEIDPSLGAVALMRGFLEQDRVRQQAQVGMGVVHRHFEHLREVWPDARYIHLIRDPRDVARSVIGMGWAGDTWHGSDPWLHAEASWDLVVADLPSERWLEVRYESLVSDHEAVLGEICEFVGVETRLDELLSYAEETAYTLPDAGLSRQWERKASERDIALVEARVGDRLEARGYTRSDVAPLKMTSSEQRRLRLQNRLFTFRSRSRRYGLMLTIADSVTSRLTVGSIRDSVIRRMNERENRRLKKSWRSGSATDRTLTEGKEDE